MFSRIDLDALAVIVRGDLDAVARVPAFDPDRFAAFVAEHQLAGFVHATLDGTSARAALSESARERLAGAFLRQWATNERLGQELRELAGAFDAAGCPFVLLKGLHLAIAYYGGADRRGISDLDLLVRKANLERASRLLAERGYARRSRALLGRQIAATFTHAFEFECNGIPVDLHWALANHPSYRIDYDEVWDRRRPFDAEGARVHVLDDEHALAFQLLAIAKDLELGTVRLKAFVDLYAIARTFDAKGDWERFFEARARERTARTASAILALAISIFGAGGRFPALDECLARATPPPAPPGLVERLATLRRSPRDRLWAVGLYESSAARVWTWWALSLPFRVAAHRTGGAPESSAR